MDLNFATAEVRLIDYPEEQPFEVKLMLDAIMVETTSIPRAQLKNLYQRNRKRIF